MSFQYNFDDYKIMVLKLLSCWKIVLHEVSNDLEAADKD